MKFTNLLTGSLLALLITTSTIAVAKNDGIDPSVTIEKNNETYVINQDGSFVMTKDIVFLINEERAIKAQGQEALSYNRTLESLDVIEAYTQKPDGRKVVVTPDQIKDQQEAQSANAPMFQDTRVKVIIFPEIAVGDRLAFQFKLNRKTPYFPGHFSDFSVANAYPIKQFRRTYDLPAGMILYTDAKGFTASLPASEKGRKRYQWDYVPSERSRMENGAVSYIDYGDQLTVSTFSDYAAWASAYEARAKDKVVITPKIKAMAEKITTGLSDPRAKALALGNWMRKNIRYVAVYIGAGGVVPHPADTILDNLYGDCKDHVTLLEAFLTAVGIDSTPALINAGNSYRLTKVPTGFNHVITYIPALDLYMDSTAESIAANYLPPVDLDKAVLLSRSGKLAHTPGTQNHKVLNSTEFKITANGAADFTHSSTAVGWPAELNRYSIRNTKQSDLDLFVERILQQYGQKGSGTFDAGKTDGISDDYQIKAKGHTDNLVNLPGPVGISSMTSFIGGIAQAVFSHTAEKERTQPFTCISGDYEEKARFEFPKEIEIVAVPKPLKLQDANFDFSSEYIREDSVVVVNRKYSFHHASIVCSPEEFKTMLPAVDTMIRDLRSQIIVQTR